MSIAMPSGTDSESNPVTSCLSTYVVNKQTVQTVPMASAFSKNMGKGENGLGRGREERSERGNG